MEKIKRLKTVDLIISLFAIGLIIYFLITRCDPDRLYKQIQYFPDLKNKIYTFLGFHFAHYLSLLVVLFMDRSRKRIPSILFLIGEIAVNIYMIISIREYYMSMFTTEDYGKPLLVMYIINAAATFLLFISILIYIIKKNKTTVFSRIYIFALPIIKILSTMQIIRFDPSTFKPDFDLAYCIDYIKDSYFSIIFWTLLAVVLFIRYRMRNLED